MDKLKTGTMFAKVEFIAQIGSLLFEGVLTTVQIIKTIKGEDEKPATVPVQSLPLSKSSIARMRITSSRYQ